MKSHLVIKQLSKLFEGELTLKDCLGDATGLSRSERQFITALKRAFGQEQVTRQGRVLLIKATVHCGSAKSANIYFKQIQTRIEGIYHSIGDLIDYTRKGRFVKKPIQGHETKGRGKGEGEGETSEATDASSK